ncbi:hypothetical protein LXL04_008972 [Taraxacum kok-saghyz]
MLGSRKSDGKFFQRLHSPLLQPHLIGDSTDHILNQFLISKSEQTKSQTLKHRPFKYTDSAFRFPNCNQSAIPVQINSQTCFYRFVEQI